MKRKEPPEPLPATEATEAPRHRPTFNAAVYTTPSGDAVRQVDVSELCPDLEDSVQSLQSAETLQSVMVFAMEEDGTAGGASSLASFGLVLPEKSEKGEAKASTYYEAQPRPPPMEVFLKKINLKFSTDYNAVVVERLADGSDNIQRRTTDDEPTSNLSLIHISEPTRRS